MHNKAKVLVAVVVVFAGIQLVRPSTVNPAVSQDITVPDNVKAVLRKGCYDCHSNQTDLKWFDKITPVNFMVEDHIKDGRKALNFSTWDLLKPAEQKAKLFWAINDIRNGVMPLSSYLMLHGSAKLTPDDVSILEHYLTDISPRKTSDSNALSLIEKQYQLTMNGSKATSIKPEWNGVAYITGFQNWKAISTSDRFDNGTVRIIYGNDIAVKAITDGHINPWPDGTIFAKSAWKANTDADGNITTGEFIQVEFMIKDATKYKSTEGWGWGRWRGLDLKPYGNNAAFTNECTTCHQPMMDNDFVFSYPFHLSK
jgi:hypothetical protein